MPTNVVRSVAASLVLGLALLGASERTARAHITVVSGNAFSNTTQEITFGVAHGCSGNDTYRVTIDIPAGVTSVRPETSDFGLATVQKDTAGNVTSVTWQKPDAAALDADTNYYKLTMRLKTADAPFSVVYFAAHQVCRAANGALSTTEWVGTPSTPATDGGAPEPAPALTLVPPRLPGWNSYTVPADLADLSLFFRDALIVWKGAAAFSANPSTTALIGTTSGVSALTSLKAGDAIRVKY
jgi:uncharacterized protein YcnI